MALNTSKLHSNELGYDFRYVATEIGMLSNGFSENLNDEPRRFRTASATSNQKQPNHGLKPSLSS